MKWWPTNTLLWVSFPQRTQPRRKKEFLKYYQPVRTESEQELDHTFALSLMKKLWVFLSLFFLCFQTNIGSILAAVNPYKQIAGLYDATAVALYSKHQMGELPPHIFAVANECYRCLWKRHDSQCVLIRWEGEKKKLSCSSGETGNKRLTPGTIFVSFQRGERSGENREHQTAAEVSLSDESKLCRYPSLREDHQGGAGPRPEQVGIIRHLSHQEHTVFISLCRVKIF